MKEQNYPPYILTNIMINYISEITRKITEIDYLNLDNGSLTLVKFKNTP